MTTKKLDQATVRIVANMFLSRAYVLADQGAEVPDYVFKALKQWVLDTDTKPASSTKGFRDDVGIGDFANVNMVNVRDKN